VIVRGGLVDEATGQALVARSAALVMAHADDDVIVSSSFFLAMSLGVPVLAVATPFLEWIAPRIGPRLLRVAVDATGLAAIARDTSIGSPDEADRATVERLLGDAAVHRALVEAFGPPP